MVVVENVVWLRVLCGWEYCLVGVLCDWGAVLLGCCVFGVLWYSSESEYTCN